VRFDVLMEVPLTNIQACGMVQHIDW